MADPLTALAARVESHADELRARAGRLAAAAATARWQSLAASTFRKQVDDLVAVMRAAAGRVDDAAAHVRQHAARVRSGEPPMRTVEQSAEALVDRVRGWVAH